MGKSGCILQEMTVCKPFKWHRLFCSQVPFSPSSVHFKIPVPDLCVQAISSYTDQKKKKATVSDMLLRYTRNEKLFEDMMQ